MKNISTLIDAGTLTKKIIVNTLHRKKESGWMICIIRGVLCERFMYYTPQGDRYILENGEQYMIDTPLKPITGDYQRHQLIGYY